MGARTIKTRGQAGKVLARRRESRTILGVLVAVLGPLFLVYLLVAADLRPDLGEARPRPGATLKGSVLIGWKPLAVEEYEKSEMILDHGPREGSVVAMVGYMMDGFQPVPELTRVTSFTLMPEAGTWIHAAHREPDEMVEVTMASDSRVPYTDRKLVSVTGRFRHLRSKLRYGEALYISAGRKIDQ